MRVGESTRHINILLSYCIRNTRDYAYEIHSGTVDAVRFYFDASETEYNAPIERVTRVDFHLLV